MRCSMELTLDQTFQQGIKAHKAGQIQEAENLYTAVLKAQPKHPDANHNLGVVAVGVGKRIGEVGVGVGTGVGKVAAKPQPILQYPG